MSKKMCKLTKDELEKEALRDYVKLIKPAKFVCKKCGRVANSEELLCKGKKVKDILNK